MFKYTFRTTLVLFVSLIMMSGFHLLHAVDVKDNVDRAIRHLRSLQNADGSYGAHGGEGTATPLVLLAYSTSPRRYTDIDGPFVRNAVEWVLARQGEDGSILHALNGKSEFLRDETPLSVAAIAAVNRYKYEEFLARGCVWLTRTAEGKRPDSVLDIGGHLFHNLLALKFSNPQALKGLRGLELPFSDINSPDEDEGRIFKAVWIVLNGRELPDSFSLEGVVTQVEDTLKQDRPLYSDGDRLKGRTSLSSDTRLWAGVYLLALVDQSDQKNRLPAEWAKSISNHLVRRIETLIENNNKNKAKEIHEIAILTNALSLCHGKGSTNQPTDPPPREILSPIVESPRTIPLALESAHAFLEKNQKEGQFGFAGFPDPGITAMVLSGVIRGHRLIGKNAPEYVGNGLEYLKALQRENGSIFQHGLATYVTSASLMALCDSKNPEYRDVIDSARNFLVTVQADEDEGYSLEEDVAYGGLGYGGDERPDLSNTQMALEALREAGLEEEHEAFRKAVYFLQKCQNLAEFNPTMVEISPTKKIRAGNDGGGIYAPGDSKADLEEVDDGIFVARSYGSMTYALLKSYIFSGMDRDDKRVKAAVKWISQHYTLEENPGFIEAPGTSAGLQGLYYYYLTMARALNALELDTIETQDGRKHDWRQELEDKILSLQRVDGSWINHLSPRWFEGNPVLATAYALLVLDECRKR